MNVKRLKKDVRVSLAYRFAFFIPIPLLYPGLGEASAGMGITAGRGNDGAGETDRREENEERRL